LKWLTLKYVASEVTTFRSAGLSPLSVQHHRTHASLACANPSFAGLDWNEMILAEDEDEALAFIACPRR
jgi:hypothetical protein